MLPELAVVIGLNEAIVLQQLHYWLDRSKHEHDGRRWIYNNLAEWQAQFPFWSEKTLQRIMHSLVEQGLVLVHKFNEKNWDRTNWYSIEYDALLKLEDQMQIVAEISTGKRRTIATKRHARSGQSVRIEKDSMAASLKTESNYRE